MSRVALLDVNVLVALFDPDHVHHDAAHDWFSDNREAGWATCPLTENGLVRIVSNPAYSGIKLLTADVVGRLRAFCGSGAHTFWPDEVSLRSEASFGAKLAVGHRQVTDVYLLALAVLKAGRLATFDRSIPVAAVKGATTGHLAVIAA